MVDGVILVVDAFEGPMPQTKFVLKKALELDLAVIVCINKCDRPEARPIQVVDEVLELFMDLDANDEQLDCPFVYASAKTGTATTQLTVKGGNMTPLFDTIIEHIPAPQGDPDAGTQLLVSTIDYNEYVGRIGVGKVDNGTIRVNQEVVIVNHHEPDKQSKVKVSKLYEFDGLNKAEVKEAAEGDVLLPGKVYIAKGGMHLKIRYSGWRHVVYYSDEPAREGVKPCANYMYESLAESKFDEVVCTVMTGMGADGTKGIAYLKNKKRIHVIAQDEDSCAVYGMPKSIVVSGLANQVVHLEQIAQEIIMNVGVM